MMKHIKIVKTEVVAPSIIIFASIISRGRSLNMSTMEKGNIKKWVRERVWYCHIYCYQWIRWTIYFVFPYVGIISFYGLTVTVSLYRYLIWCLNSIIIAIAMEDEASPFVSHLGLKQDADFFPAEAPFKAFRGSHKTCEVTVVTNGQDSVYGE